MSEQHNSLRTIFVEALEIEDVEQRAAFLAQACGADSALRREVAELIQAHAAAGKFLPEQPAVTGAREALLSTARSLGPGGAASIVPVSESPGDRIGRYKLLQQIGEGGCGVVYMAEQEEPVRRRVALKVIKLGMDTKQVVARFEAERQALALMDHPNIAKVFDAGATETGRPYFVMELVRGTKITEYCDENELSTRERLELFIQVCLAVQHAHQKGIIHRDLKPSNILVTVNDAKPVPKVIDFGIAKATEGRLTDHTLFTAFDQFLGTPAYMSPEQTVMTNQDIDTRSDIYSLGVLLYELLTGKTPFDTKELMAVGMDELRRTIQEKEPMRPSTRLKAMLHEELTTTARHRHSEPPKLIHLLHGDLDWIVMKCLEKDRARRYETANGLAMDTQRHLNCQPVVARPPSRLYEFQKTVRRHKVGFVATAVVIASLTAGILFSGWQAVLARRAEREQGRLRVVAVAAQQQALQEAKHARAAEMDAREKLRASYLAQAKAERWSRRAGRRFEGLEVLKQAAEIRPGLDLRNEAIACMALPDFRLEKELDCRPSLRGVFLDSTAERYAVGDERGNVYVRAIADNRELAHLRGFGVGTRGVAFIPDSRLIAVGYDIPHHGELRIWDWAQTNVVLRPPVEDLASFVFSATGRLAAIAQISRLSLLIYDIERGRVLRSVPQTSQVFGIAFDPAGQRLAFGNDESSRVQVLDVETGAIESLTNSSPAYTLAWNAEGSLLATGCYDGRICIWDTIAGKNRATIAGHQSAVVQVSFNKAGDLLLSTSWDGTMRLWSAVTGTEICSRPICGYLAQFADVDRRLLCLTSDKKLGVFEVASGRECRLLPFDEKSARVSSCTFSPDGQVLVSAHQEGLRFWDPNRGRQIGFEPIGNTRTAVFHPSGKSLITNGRDGLRRWPIEIAHGAALHELKMGPAEELHWSTDLNQSTSFDHEKRLAVAVRDGRGYLFDLNTRAEKASLVPDAPLRFAALSGDAQRCAVGHWESKSMRVYDVESGSLLTDLPADNLHIAAFSPDNGWLVGAGYFEYSFWSTASWQSVGKLRRQSVGYIDTAIAFLPNSRMVALADANWIRLVEPATGREFATLESPVPGNVSSLAFSPDGTKLAACGWNHSIQLWDLRLIRQQLASMNLDWELPSYPDSVAQPAPK